MPDLKFVLLPNMDIYFNQILAAALILYIISFQVNERMLDSTFKDHIKPKDYFSANLLLDLLRCIPAFLIIFSMYNIDNPSIINVLKYNECQQLINNNSRYNIMPYPNIPTDYQSRTVHGVDYNFTNETWQYIDNGTRP